MLFEYYLQSYFKSNFIKSIFKYFYTHSNTLKYILNIQKIKILQYILRLKFELVTGYFLYVVIVI